jgi:hypothetical protein
MIFFTSICSNYLPKAMALAESVKKNCAGSYFVLCLVEREIPPEALAYPHFDKIILAKDAGWENFDSVMFRHSIVEASTAVKPRFMAHLLQIFPEWDKFVFLDPDVIAYSEFMELESLLDTESIVLCPHLLRPGNIDMEISSLAHGSYNLGFFAVSRSANADAFLAWWAERLFSFCYDDKSRGIFTDQKWIDLAPIFFDVHTLKHHGYDFATWSLLGSDLREIDGEYVVNGDKLRFIHFSGLDSGIIDRAIGWWLTPDNRDTFVALYQEYLATLARHGQEELGKLAWTYATYENGAPIGKAARLAYRDPEMWARFPQPFAASDAELVVAPTADAVATATPQGLPGDASILDRFMRSSLDIGFRPTLVKAFRKLSGIQQAR